MIKRRIATLVLIAVGVLLLTGCGRIQVSVERATPEQAQPTPPARAAEMVSHTPAPKPTGAATFQPTDTPEPTSTPTPIPLTPTPVPPTATPVPPTPTPVPPTPTPVPPTAIVVDTSGKAYTVTNLIAKYTAGGMWIGFFSRPTAFMTGLNIRLYFTKDRVTTTEMLMVPFDSMRRLVFEGASVPGELEEVFEGQEPIRIEMRDGSIILLFKTLLIEMDAEGNQTKVVEMDRYLFWAGKDEKDITLDGFSGRAKTESGEEGDFWIYRYKTQSIEFKWP